MRKFGGVSPADFNDNNANVWNVNDNFNNDNVNNNNLSARPVINLNTGIRITAGSGTTSDPYIIE